MGDDERVISSSVVRVNKDSDVVEVGEIFSLLVLFHSGENPTEEMDGLWYRIKFDSTVYLVSSIVVDEAIFVVKRSEVRVIGDQKEIVLHVRAKQLSHSHYCITRDVQVCYIIVEVLSDKGDSSFMWQLTQDPENMLYMSSRAIKCDTYVMPLKPHDWINAYPIIKGFYE